ncbi:MAG: hypothetical protein B7X95_00145 [Methylophilaceae bacterium 17-44-8]|jgi:hypothetical protein|nr:MAG: hypothetical protein B7X95_00145 [Methylophilaceae bacterium 17-44-8]
MNMWTKILTRVLIGTAALMVVQTSYAAVPKSIQLTYEVKRNGKLFGHVTESFRHNGKQYTLESTTKGTGVYALLGERKLLSQGDVTKDGLRPKHFESLQSTSSKKTLINDFDWKARLLTMQVKGDKQQVTLVKGTQDLLSVMYQFMFKPPVVGPLKLSITTGKRLKTHQYQVSAQASPLVTDAGQFKVVELVEKEDEEAKKIYLAVDKYALPVKIVVQDDGATFEQLITHITIE